MPERTSSARVIGVKALVSILLFLTLFISIAWKPMHLDSVDFAGAAGAAAQTGKPVYYRGEWNQQYVGLWHPPLYIYLLAGWFKVFGTGATQGCAFGMICALFQGILVLRIVQALFGGAWRASMEPWFWAAFLLNPYTIQSAAVLDIDSTIYGPLLCLLLLAALRLTWRDGRRREDEPSRSEYAWLALTVAVALWAKLTTILLVIPFVGLLLISRFGFWRAVRITALAAAAGVSAFLVTYFAYGAFFHLDVTHTFDFLLFSLRERGSSGNAGLAARILDFRTNAVSMVPFMVRWTGLLPWLACLGAMWIAARWALVRGCARAQHYFLLLLLCAGTTLYYCGQTQTFGASPFKYTFVFWGLTLTAPLILAAGNPVWEVPSKEESVGDGFLRGAAIPWILAVLFLAAAWYGRFVLGDKQLLEYRTEKWLQLVPALLALPVICDGMRDSRWRLSARTVLLAGISLWVGLELGIVICQAKASYSTTYDYGETGMEDAAAFLRLNTAPGDAIASMKDLGYLCGRRYYENYIGLFGGPEATRHFIDVLGAGKVRFAVFTAAHGQDQLPLNPTLQEWVGSHCTLIASFGDYRIYRINGA